MFSFAVPAAQADGSLVAPACPPNAKPVPGGCIPRGSAFVVRGERCPHARKAVAFFRNLTWKRQTARGGELADRTPSVRGKTCRWARYAAGEWAARARSARSSLERWLKTHTLAAHDTWREAVREAQKAYPGTDGWLLSCSSSEGGWGRWVPTSQGSGVGGWLQMFPSTFWRMFSAARADVRARGFRVPKSAASWYSPLGQALGGAWAIRNGRRHEWVGHGC